MTVIELKFAESPSLTLASAIATGPPPPAHAVMKSAPFAPFPRSTSPVTSVPIKLPSTMLFPATSSSPWLTLPAIIRNDPTGSVASPTIVSCSTNATAPTSSPSGASSRKMKLPEL